MSLAPATRAAFRVDPEFAALIPPLTREERTGLEASLQAEGCRDALVYWREGGVLLDGHNRFEICTRLDLPFDTRALSFPDRDAAKVWMIRNQFGRRNLTPYQRAELALALEPLIAAKAKANLVTSTGGANPQPLQISVKAEKVDTQKELAALAGLSHDTIHKAKVVHEKADDATKEKLRRGETTINKEYQEIRRLDKKEERRTQQQHAIEKAKAGRWADVAIKEAAIDSWDIANESADLIFTDPPYHDKHVVEYESLGHFAMRALKPGRYLCCYAGKLRLPTYINTLQKAGLEWVWIFSVFHPYSKEKHLGGAYNIAENWRPVLVWRKPGPLWKPAFQQDVVRAERNKDYHDWSQDEQTAKQLIEAYSHPEEWVLDPFCGGGTTPYMARECGRYYRAADIDPAAVALTLERLHGA